MGLVDSTRRWTERLATEVRAFLRPKYPAFFRHAGLAGGLLLVLPFGADMAFKIFGVPGLTEAAAAVLLGTYGTALAGVLLFANARILDEMGVREMLAVELDQVAYRLDWPEELAPVENKPVALVVPTLRTSWDRAFSPDGLDSVRPKLILLPSRLIDATLDLYRDLADYHEPANKPDEIDEVAPYDPSVEPVSAREFGIADAANQRAALSLRAARLAHDLSFTKTRDKRAKDLKSFLESQMPNALKT